MFLLQKKFNIITLDDLQTLIYLYIEARVA